MIKYRIRLNSGRVIGPLKKEQFPELLQKNHIEGDEDCQVYPTGDWKSIKLFDELVDILSSNEIEKESTEATFIKKISDFKKELEISEEILKPDPEQEYPEKFVYEKKTPFSNRNVDVSTEEEEEIDEKKNDVLNTDKKLKESKVEDPAGDKTIVNLDTKKYLEQLRIDKVNQEIEDKEEEESKRLEEEAQIDLDNDSTQFINLKEFKNEIGSEIKDSEKVLKEESRTHRKEQKQIALKKKKLELRKQKEIEEEEEEEDDGGKKKKILIVAAIAVVLFLLFGKEEGNKKLKKIVTVPPSIEFPQRYDQPNRGEAEKLHKKAILLLKNPTYVKKIKAARLLLASAENQFNNNKALGRLIFVYSQLLEDSETKIEDANTIFKLVQIFKTKAIIDPLFTAGVSLFYLNIDKPYAAVKTIEKFNAVKKNSPTLELFAVYLKSVVKVGDLIKAKAIAKKLMGIKTKPLFVELALFDYFVFITDYTKASEVVVSASKIFKRSIPLMLRRASLLFYQEDFKSLSILLKEIRILEAERSKVYYAKYLEYRALEAVKNNKIKRAISLFKKALVVHESSELRTRLASLGESSNSDANYLIRESKSLQLIANSKNQLKKNNWKFAFKDALEATRIAPDFIVAKLYLADLQINQSIFSEAIKTLESLYKDYPHNDEIVFKLFDAYIEAYKFADVKRLFAMTSTSEIRNKPRYFSLTAKYYVYKEDFYNSVTWLQKAINKNPLNDYNTYELAKMFIKHAKYNKGKMYLNKAMDLDPSNVQYRISFARILYEIDGSDAAVGYLYDVLQDFPDNPKILSQIGIFHYKSGQTKSFETIKERLLKLPHRDTSLYEFLIKAAQLDDKLDLVVENSKKLIELNPGDLKTRLNLGRIYIEMNKYKEALLEFKSIESRLDTYPKLQYFMSRLYLLTDNNEMAIELAKKEIKANPTSEDGYILLGDIYRKEATSETFLKAENQYKKAQKINGQNVDMLIGLATINFKRSQYEIALDLFQRARNNEPSRPEIHKLLGDAYRKTSQSTLAIESYKMFLELSPTSKYKSEIDNYIKMME